MSAPTGTDVPRLSSEEFLEKLRRLTVRTSSPDKSVTATLTFDGTRVGLGPRGTRGHSEETLGKQMSAAIEATQHGYQRAVAMLMEQATGKPAPSKPPAPESADGRYFAALDAMAIETRSPLGCVLVRRRGVTGVRVVIRPRTLEYGTVGDEELVADVNAALKGAEEEYGRKFSVHKANRFAEGY